MYEPTPLYCWQEILYLAQVLNSQLFREKHLSAAVLFAFITRRHTLNICHNLANSVVEQVLRCTITFGRHPNGLVHSMVC